MAHSTDSLPTPATHTTVELVTTVGLDLSDRVSHFHVLLGDGRTLACGKVATLRPALSELFQKWKGCRLVIDAGWTWWSRIRGALS